VSAARGRHGSRGVWQRRFWEHAIRDEHDFERHFDYIHYNPIKHGLVRHLRDWPYSSFHRWVRQGVYEPDWGRLDDGRLQFNDLDETAME
jgi:putative transposase